VSNTAVDHQRAILRYLYDRMAQGETRYCTWPTIRKNTDLNGSTQYLAALADDLETSGLIITRQAYKMSGGRLLQITARGIDLIENDAGPIRVESSAWTGEYNLTVQQKAEVSRLLREIRREIDQSRLSNAKKANALALVSAAEILVEAPDPQWPEIMRLLRSPTLGNIVGIAGFIYAIVQTLISASV
jgi:hypothetical protein